MSFHWDLLDHAINLLNLKDEQPSDVAMRRAVSAAYYSLFHRLHDGAVTLIAPNVSANTKHRIQRWFDHAEMKKVCTRFTQAKLDQPLAGLIGEAASRDLQSIALSFIKLQEARRSADYDLGYILTFEQAFGFVKMAVHATESWERIASSEEANIFVLSLLLSQKLGERSLRGLRLS